MLKLQTMLKHKHLIFSLLFVTAMLMNALHTIADHHSHSDCQVCVVDDHSNATPAASEISFDESLHDILPKRPIPQTKWHSEYILPYGHAPPLLS